MRLTLSSLALAASTTVASAAVIDINNNVLAATGVDPDDGVRTVVATDVINLPSFDVLADVFLFDFEAFGVTGPLAFVNSLASGLVGSKANVIVLQDSDNDANPATPFNAGTAANLIAAALDTDGAGFFVYFNQTLNINRLVYSTNLNEVTADLQILAAIQSPTGADAVAALPTFTAANVAAVPLPASLPMLLAGLLGLRALRRRARA
jgi:hypothetical protein